MNTRISHTNCTHASTPAARTACRKAKAANTVVCACGGNPETDGPILIHSYRCPVKNAIVTNLMQERPAGSCDYCGGLNKTHVYASCPAAHPDSVIVTTQAKLDIITAGFTTREKAAFARQLANDAAKAAARLAKRKGSPTQTII